MTNQPMYFGYAPLAQEEKRVTSESAIERKLKAKLKTVNALFMKFTSPGFRGVPDRICVYGGRVIFVELKNEVGEVLPHQEIAHTLLCEAGAEVAIVSGLMGAKGFYNWLVGGDTW